MKLYTHEYQITKWLNWQNAVICVAKQVSFKKEVGVMVNDLAFWLTVCLILKMCY